MKSLVVSVGLLAACGSSSGWSEQEAPQQQQFLTSLTVWVAGEDDVWLGGSALWHNDGSGWTESAPGPIVDFWGFSPTDIWAIGDAKVLHWDGASWKDVPANNGVTFDAMWRLWGASSTDIWIANTDNSRVFHYDGTNWTRTTLQFVAADALWGASSNDIWLSGTTDIYRYNGTTWMPYTENDAPRGAEAFWGFGANDVWAAGSFDELSHWDGSRWTVAEGDFGGYNGIWGSSPDDIWAVGSLGETAHYDGDSWSTSRPLGYTENFTMVHGSSADNVWATAVNLQEGRALVLRKD